MIPIAPVVDEQAGEMIRRPDGKTFPYRIWRISFPLSR